METSGNLDNTRGNTSGDWRYGAHAVCEDTGDAPERSDPFFADSCSASTVNHVRRMDKTTLDADAQSMRQSVFFSQEACSVFDKALAMHAASTDDPPMWGDELDDLQEVADMFDIDDISVGNEVPGQIDTSSYPPNNSKAASIDLEAQTGDNGRGGIDGSSAVAFNDETDSPVHIMNMDMSIGDITQAESEDAMHYSGEIFDSAAMDIPNTKRGSPTSLELKSTPGELPLGERLAIADECSIRDFYSEPPMPNEHLFAPKPHAKATPEHDIHNRNNTKGLEDSSKMQPISYAAEIGQQACSSDDAERGNRRHGAAWKRRFLELKVRARFRDRMFPDETKLTQMYPLGFQTSIWALCSAAKVQREHQVRQSGGRVYFYNWISSNSTPFFQLCLRI